MRSVVNPLPSHIAAASRIADLHREAERSTLAMRARRQARADAPYPVRRALGWWLVSAGLRLAHPTKARRQIAVR
jgi:hypothetical protein